MQIKRRGVYVNTKHKEVQSSLKHRAFSVASFEASYFAGILYGDGCTRNNQIRLSMTDWDIVFSFAKFVAFPLDHIKNDTRGKLMQFRVEFSSKQMLQDLAAYGFIHSKAKGEFEYPYDVVDRAFLLGLYDSDGSCPTNRSRGFYWLGNVYFANSLSTKLKELGFLSRVRLTYKSESCELYKIELSGKSHVAFLTWLYDPTDTPVFCKRKFLRVLCSLRASKEKSLFAKWVNSWKALRPEMDRLITSQASSEEGVETRLSSRRFAGNPQIEVPTTLRGDDIVRYPMKVGLT